MTEYDFSPAAIHQFQEKQRSIHRWVSETKKHSPSNPFVPELPQRAQTFNVVRPPPPPPERRVSSSSSRPTTSSRPKHTRSRTEAYPSKSSHTHSRHRQQPSRSSTTPVYPTRPPIYQQQSTPQYPANYYYMQPQRGQMTTTPYYQPQQPQYPYPVQLYSAPPVPKRGVFTRIVNFVSGKNPNSPPPTRQPSRHNKKRRDRGHSY